MIKRENLVKELKVIFTYCWIPLPLALIWSLFMGGFSNYNQFLIPFTGISFEVFTMVAMICYADYARLYPKVPVPSSSQETKTDIFQRGFAAFWIFVATFVFTVQVANYTIEPEIIDGRPLPPILSVIERPSLIRLPFLQMGLVSCVSFVRVLVNASILLIRINDMFKYLVYGLLFPHYLLNYVVPLLY